MTKKKYTVQAAVLAVSPKEDKDYYSLKVKAEDWDQPRWLTGFDTMPPVDVGDEVMVTIREVHKEAEGDQPAKTFYNIDTIEVLTGEQTTGEPPGKPSPAPHQQINLAAIRMQAQAIMWGSLRLPKPPSKKERDEIHRGAAEIVRYALTGATRDAEGEDE